MVLTNGAEIALLPKREGASAHFSFIFQDLGSKKVEEEVKSSCSSFIILEGRTRSNIRD
jgi:hypothetical protein